MFMDTRKKLFSTHSTRSGGENKDFRFYPLAGRPTKSNLLFRIPTIDEAAISLSGRFKIIRDS